MKLTLFLFFKVFSHKAYFDLRPYGFSIGFAKGRPVVKSMNGHCIEQGVKVNMVLTAINGREVKVSKKTFFPKKV